MAALPEGTRSNAALPVSKAEQQNPRRFERCLRRYRRRRRASAEVRP